MQILERKFNEKKKQEIWDQAKSYKMEMEKLKFKEMAKWEEHVNKKVDDEILKKKVHLLHEYDRQIQCIDKQIDVIKKQFLIN